MFSFANKLTEPLMGADETPKPILAKRKSTGTKVEEAMKKAADSADANESLNPVVGSCLRASGPVLAAATRAVLYAWPYISVAYAYCYKVYKAAPKNVVAMAFGAALCFFGGTFVASIAAIEAFRMMGWQTVYAELSIVLAECQKVSGASLKDDQLDEDNDGVADVDQIPPHQLATRKIVLAMRTVADPDRLQTAVGALWASYLAVLATLKMEFAQTTAIAMGLVEIVQFPMTRYCAPPLSAALGPPLNLQHWAKTLLEVGLKLIAVMLAWYLQMVISAVYSALRGGRIFALALCALIDEKGWTSYVEKLPYVKAPFDPDTSYFDEAVGYSLGAAGVLWQLATGFGLPFPLSLIFLPLEILEWLLRWQITFGAPAAGPAITG